MNAIEFGKIIEEWAKKQEQRLYDWSYQFTYDVFEKAILESPDPNHPRAKYSMGRFVFNCQVDSSPSYYSLVGEQTSAQRISKLKQEIPKDYFRNNKQIYMVNNLDYAKNVEYMGWTNEGQKYAPVLQAENYIRAKYGA